jgi:hypothetical protein
VPSIEPYISSDHEYGSQEVSGSFIVACGDAPELLEFGEEIFDQVARFVQVFVVGAGCFSVGFWRYDNIFSGPFEWVYDSLIGIEGFISKDCFSRNIRQERI